MYALRVPTGDVSTDARYYVPPARCSRTRDWIWEAAQAGPDDEEEGDDDEASPAFRYQVQIPARAPGERISRRKTVYGGAAKEAEKMTAHPLALKAAGFCIACSDAIGHPVACLFD